MMQLLTCFACGIGVLLPLSDYNHQNGGEVLYAAWVCNKPNCHWTLQIRKGDVTITEGIPNPRAI